MRAVHCAVREEREQRHYACHGYTDADVESCSPIFSERPEHRPTNGHNRFHAVISPPGLNNSLSFGGQHQHFMFSSIGCVYAWVNGHDRLGDVAVFGHGLVESCSNPTFVTDPQPEMRSRLPEPIAAATLIGRQRRDRRRLRARLRLRDRFGRRTSMYFAGLLNADNACVLSAWCRSSGYEREHFSERAKKMRPSITQFLKPRWPSSRTPFGWLSIVKPGTL